MLQIKNISKTYKTGDLIQQALDNVSLSLRDNEFVAILGPSGSGKTTLLNIIGGLDRYDTGDLVINNISTKKYKDRDWDAYRNHTIGFVFQSYNLIPHQSVLANVELALTISGISKKERRNRALNALEEVGLKEQAHKKPNQMSGGQMQRVAIARALVNNPDILLADEPTGALDSKTSIQVMDLLKKVAQDRLVVMVTHNPELANEYANRIVKLQDGHIISDSNPYIIVDDQEKIENKRIGKAKMGFITALSLSFNNLLTKKGRTILTAFAGSIGIIGIALILSLSQGFQNYIDKIQEDTLTSYPLQILNETADATSAILSMVSGRDNIEKGGNTVSEQQYLTNMFTSIGTNDLKSFKKYLEDNADTIKNDVTNIKYSYSVTPLIYTIDAANNLAKLNPSSLLNNFYSASSISFFSSYSSSSVFNEMSDDLDTIKDQYELLEGNWPSAYNDLIIVLSEPNAISDLLVYSLGLRDTKELSKMMSDLMEGKEVNVDNEPLKFTYQDLMNIKLKLIASTDMYQYNEKYNIYEDMSDDNEYMLDLYNKSIDLNIVGVVCAKEGSDATLLMPGVSYTSKLVDHVIKEASKTTIVQKQINNEDIDVFSNKSFDEANKDNEKDSGLDFNDMVTVDEDMLKDAFKINISEDDLAIDMDAMTESIAEYTTDMIASLTTDTKPAYIDVESTLKKLCKNYLDGYISEFANEGYVTFNDTNNSTYKSSYLLSNDLFVGPIKELKDKYKYPEKDVPDMITPALGNIVPNIYTIMQTSKTGNPVPVSFINTETVANSFVDTMSTDNTYVTGINQLSSALTKFVMMDAVTNNVGKLVETCLEPLSALQDLFGEDMMEIDTDKFAQAFKFDMDEDQLSRIMSQMMSSTSEKSRKSNLISLGYQEKDDPTSISFYFKDFEAKENFLTFIEDYNKQVNDEDKEINYTDITGILMSSVKTIVDSVSYVLIAFVSISLVVSSIMIAVITLISVMERTKEIGILRAMGASKANVSSIFNAETFIIGLLSGCLGIGVTLAAIPPINALIHNLTDNYNINAVLPTKYALILILISVVLTMLAGLIPSRKAAKQDPVIALRSE